MVLDNDVNAINREGNQFKSVVQTLIVILFG
jgi:hypothetical protein